MVLKNIRLERSKANGMIVTFILCGSVMNCRLAEAQKPQISTAKQKQDGGRDTGDRQLKKSGGQKGGGQKVVDKKVVDKKVVDRAVVFSGCLI